MALGSCVLVALLLFAVFSVLGRVSAERNRREVLMSESEFLAAEANELCAQGDRYQAVQVAMGALPQRVDESDRPFVPVAQMALEGALGVYPHDGDWVPNYSTYGVQCYGCAYAEDGRVAALDRDGTVVVFDAGDGTECGRIDVSDLQKTDLWGVNTLRIDFAEQGRIICRGDDVAACYEVETGKRLWKIAVEGCDTTSGCAVSADGTCVALVGMTVLPDHDPTLRLIDVGDGSVRTIELTGFRRFEYGIGSCVAFDALGDRVAVGLKGNLFVVGVADGDVRREDLAYVSSDDVAFVDDAIIALSHRPVDADGVVSVQAFDDDLARRWSYEDHGMTAFDGDGAVIASEYRICNLHALSGDESTDACRLCVLLGGPLVLLDVETGRSTYRLVRDAPIIECALHHRRQYDGHMQDTFVIVTSGGEVLVRSVPVEEEKVATDDSPSLHDVNLGVISASRILWQREAMHLVLWSYEPARCRSYTFGGQGMLLDEDQTTYAFAKDTSFVWQGFRCLALTDDKLSVLDEATLEPTLTIDRGAMPHIDPDKRPAVCFSVDDVLYAYGYEVDDEGEQTSNTRVYRFDSRDGSMLGEFACEGVQLGSADLARFNECTLPSGERGLVLYDPSTILVADARDGHELCRIERGGGSVRKVMLFGQTLVVLRATSSLFGDAQGGLLAYDVTTGEKLDLPVLSYSVMGEDANRMAADVDRMRLTFACEDGAVRTFDMRDGTLLWETAPILTGVSGVFVDMVSGNALLQDERGCLMLVSEKDGTILRATSAIVPAINAFGMLGDGMGVARYERVGLANNIGLVIVSTDQGRFGPMSHIRGGAFVNKDASRVAIRDADREQMVVTHRLTLAQLQEMSEVMARERSLTDAERLIYGLS